MTDVVSALAAALADRYRVERLLGEGGMATVYLARDLKHERWVAIKVLRPDLAAVLGAERFLREIRVAAGLQHPHILALYDSGEIAGHPERSEGVSLLYYVMPFVEGESLRDRLDQEGRLPAAEAIRLTRQIADALDYAHRHGVIHRDIKPENVLLSEGHALVADFGIARPASSPGDSLTRTGVVVGTPAYMSPEQALGEFEVDGRTDQYSLGCLLYEMLTGMLPFQAPTAQAMLARRITEPAPTLAMAGGSGPLPLELALGRALAPDRDERFATLGEFSAALATALHAVPAAEVPARAGGDAVLVLDFANLSHTPDLDWLASGIAETVTTDLKKIEGLRLVHRQDVVRALGGRPPAELSDADIAALGSRFGARWVVRGAFQSAGSRIRITPQFHDTGEGRTVSARKLDGSLDDIFTLQDEIVADLVAALDIELSHQEHAEIARPETERLEAYEHYARGRHAFNSFGERGLAEAREHYQKAIGIDPSYALAYSGLGSITIFRFIATTDPDDLEEGISHLRRASELDPGLAEPFQWLTYAYTRARRWDEARAAGNRAVELDPSAGHAAYFLAVAENISAEAERSWDAFVRAAKWYYRATELEPQFIPSYSGLALLYLLDGEPGPAREFLERSRHYEQTNTTRGHAITGGSSLLLSRLELQAGRLAEARMLADEAEGILQEANHIYAKTLLGLAWLRQGSIALAADQPDLAMRHFLNARTQAREYPDRIGSGHVMVRSLIGMARTFLSLDTRQEAAQHFAEAWQLWQARDASPYDFQWGWEMSEPMAWLDFARYHAQAGERDQAVACLEEAAASGWGDLDELDHHPLARLLGGGHEGLDRLRDQVSQRPAVPLYPLGPPAA